MLDGRPIDKAIAHSSRCVMHTILDWIDFWWRCFKESFGTFTSLFSVARSAFVFIAAVLCFTASNAKWQQMEKRLLAIVVFMLAAACFEHMYFVVPPKLYSEKVGELSDTNSFYIGQLTATNTFHENQLTETNAFYSRQLNYTNAYYQKLISALQSTNNALLAERTNSFTVKFGGFRMSQTYLANITNSAGLPEDVYGVPVSSHPDSAYKSAGLLLDIRHPMDKPDIIVSKVELEVMDFEERKDFVGYRQMGEFRQAVYTCNLSTNRGFHVCTRVTEIPHSAFKLLGTQTEELVISPQSTATGVFTFRVRIEFRLDDQTLTTETTSNLVCGVFSDLRRY